ncbi:MAG: hypothetical protein D4S01_04365 [Dehalococcoidia bacterium]|nr:MAG: hypothetical protein D4S01_04365 [Dehalococcoidia bacterium]
MKPLIVGYYTKDTPYELEFRKLVVSLEALGYDYHYAAITNQGSWQKNTQFKAQVIESMLMKHNRPVLYLDVDAVMVQPPIACDNITTPIAAVHYADSSELLSGTVYFTPEAMPTVKRWQELNELYPEVLPNGQLAWDQRTLEMAIHETNCPFTELPQEYTWIVELTQKRFPGLAPVILHTRGALRFQDIMNEGAI